jgi:hypothetical protein
MTLLEILAVVVAVFGLKVGITNEVRARRERKYRRDALTFYDRRNTK